MLILFPIFAFLLALLNPVGEVRAKKRMIEPMIRRSEKGDGTVEVTNPDFCDASVEKEGAFFSDRFG